MAFFPPALSLSHQKLKKNPKKTEEHFPCAAGWRNTRQTLCGIIKTDKNNCDPLKEPEHGTASQGWLFTFLVTKDCSFIHTASILAGGCSFSALVNMLRLNPLAVSWCLSFWLFITLAGELTDRKQMCHK